MAKVILRTGGFALYFMGFFAVLFFCCVLISILLPVCSLIENTATITVWGMHYTSEPLWFMSLEIIMFGWMTYYFSFYILSNQIILDDDVLIINIFKRPWNNCTIKEMLIVQKETAKFRLANIESVHLGTGKYLDNLPEKKAFQILKDKIEDLKNKKAPLVTSGMAFPFPVWLAMKHTPFCYFRLKGADDFFMDTKPFSKKGFVRFIGTLKEKGVKINIGDLEL